MSVDKKQQLKQQQPDDLSNNLSTGGKQRRYFTASVAGIGALLPFVPKSWTKPVVDSVMMPAHAQMTGAGAGGGTGGSSSGSSSSGGGTATISDQRLKTDIEQLGASDQGFTIYRYRYIGQHELHYGVMAQDLVDTHPHAVIMGDDGYYRVDYDALGLDQQSLATAKLH